MKKTFKLTDPKIKVPRLVEAIKHEVRKYIKRQRRRELPEKVDFLDFDCRFGVDEAGSESIHVDDIDKTIEQAASQQLESFYLEIIGKPGHRTKKPETVKPKTEQPVTEKPVTENPDMKDWQSPFRANK